VRQLAVALRINANTVARVYAELEKTGVLETRRGVGTFVRSPQPEPASQHERERDLRALADRFLSEAAAAGFTPEELMEHVARRTKKERHDDRTRLTQE
jgi:GntR family transcriptional regulator